LGAVILRTGARTVYIREQSLANGRPETVEKSHNFSLLCLKSGLLKINSWEFAIKLFEEECKVPLLDPVCAAWLAAFNAISAGGQLWRPNFLPVWLSRSERPPSQSKHRCLHRPAS
jgi:hypothetical protein